MKATELKRRGVTYAQLVEKLADIGVSETEPNFRNKVGAGKIYSGIHDPMSRRNWLHIAAIIGLTISCPIHDHSNAQPATAEGHEKVDRNLQPALPVDLSPLNEQLNRIGDSIEGLKSKPESEDERRRAESDLKAQQDMAWWAATMAFLTGVSLLVSGIGVASVIVTLRQNQRAMAIALSGVRQSSKSARETKRVGEAQVRAYLTFDAVQLVLVTMNGIDGVPQFHFTLTNSGNSPASKIEVTARCVVYPPVTGNQAEDSSGGFLIDAIRGGSACPGYVHIGMRLPASERAGQPVMVRVSVLVKALDVFDQHIGFDQMYYAIVKERVGNFPLVDWAATGISPNEDHNKS